jgi:alkanesulfonate monooxygenase
MDVLTRTAGLAESVGFDSVWVSDHFFLPDEATSAVGGNLNRKGLVDAWSTLACIAPMTHKVKLGTCVTNMMMRNPSELARTVSTLDYFSGGRVILGAGAGWLKDEFEAFGFPFEPFRTRMAKMEEGLTVMKQLWESDGPVRFSGKYYVLNNAEVNPKPVHGRIPVWLGGSSDTALDVIARLGDGWMPWCPTKEVLRNGIADIKQKLTRLGRDMEEMSLASCFVTYVRRTQSEVESGCGEFLRHRADFSAGQKKSMFGTPEQLIDEVSRFAELGLTHIVFELAIDVAGMDDTVRLLGQDVIHKI